MDYSEDSPAQRVDARLQRMEGSLNNRAFPYEGAVEKSKDRPLTRIEVLENRLSDHEQRFEERFNMLMKKWELEIGEIREAIGLRR